MKAKFLGLFLLLATLLAIAAPPRAQARDEVSFDFFYDSLSPYGEWVQAGDYGLVWHPSGVNEDWAPYTDGYWAYTDAGWTWVSYEDFGGITYHYGRWTKLEDEGWVWVPDYDWAPAWVSWRHSGGRGGVAIEVGGGGPDVEVSPNDDYVGWAPLPPECHFDPGVGVSTWVDVQYDIGPGFFHFCHVRDFGAPVIREVLIPRDENVTIIRNTVNITNITVNNNGQTFVGGPNYTVMAARTARPIPALKLVQQTNIGRGSARGALTGGVQRGNTLVVSAPVVARPADPAALASKFKPSRTIAKPAVAHGWDVVKAPAQREALQQQFRQQVKGATPQTAHARPVTAAEVKPVPQKANPNAPVAITREPRPAPTAPTAAGSPIPGIPTAGAPAATPGVAGRGKNKGKAPAVVAPPASVPGEPATAANPGAPGSAPATPPPTAARGKNKGRTPAAAMPPVAPTAETPAGAGGGFVPPGAAPRSPASAAETPAATPPMGRGKNKAGRTATAAPIPPTAPASTANADAARAAAQERAAAAAQQKSAAAQEKAAGAAQAREAAQSRAAQVEAREAAQARSAQAAQAKEAAQARSAQAAQAKEAAQARSGQAAQAREAAQAQQARSAQAAQSREAAQAQQMRAAQVQQMREAQAAQARAAQARQAPAPAAAAPGKRPLTKAELEALKKEQGR